MYNYSNRNYYQPKDQYENYAADYYGSYEYGPSKMAYSYPSYEYSKYQGQGYPNYEYPKYQGQGYPNYEYPKYQGQGYPNYEYPKYQGQGYPNYEYPKYQGQVYPNYEYPKYQGQTYPEYKYYGSYDHYDYKGPQGYGYPAYYQAHYAGSYPVLDYRIINQDYEYVIELLNSNIDYKNYEISVVGNELRIKSNSTSQGYSVIYLPYGVDYAKVKLAIEGEKVKIYLPKYVYNLAAGQKSKAS